MADVLTTTISIKNGDDEFIFRIPSPRDYGRLAVRARTLRMQADPDGASEEGLDYFTSALYRGMALFEVLLDKASVTWPWTQTPSGLKIMSENFPPNSIKTIVEVFGKFDDALAKFLYGGPGDGQPDGGENMVGQQDT